MNEQLKTSNPNIYAIGDVMGGPQFTHLANYHAGIVIRNALFRLRPRASAAHIPRVTYTDPELAQVGLTEAEARKKYRRIRILRWPYADNDRAQTESTTHGFIKVITRQERPDPRLHHRRRRSRRIAPALDHGAGRETCGSAI